MSPPPEVNGPVWVVPFEAVRASLTPQASIDLAALISKGVTFNAHARVELGARGFVALVGYSYAGNELRHVVPLIWAPAENKVAVPA